MGMMFDAREQHGDQLSEKGGLGRNPWAEQPPTSILFLMNDQSADQAGVDRGPDAVVTSVRWFAEVLTNMFAPNAPHQNHQASAHLVLFPQMSNPRVACSIVIFCPFSGGHMVDAETRIVFSFPKRGMQQQAMRPQNKIHEHERGEKMQHPIYCIRANKPRVLKNVWGPMAANWQNFAIYKDLRTL